MGRQKTHTCDRPAVGFSPKGSLRHPRVESLVSGTKALTEQGATDEYTLVSKSGRQARWPGSATTVAAAWTHLVRLQWVARNGQHFHVSLFELAS